MIDDETTPVPPKPGYKTTEFWLKIGALALSAVFASGALTNNTALAIAGIAATVLTALGYTVSRTVLKAAALFLVIGLAGSTQLSCATVRPVAADVVTAELDCTSAALVAVVKSIGNAAETYLAGKISGDAQSFDTSAIRSDLRALGSVAWSCAVSTALAVILHPPAVARTTLHVAIFLPPPAGVRAAASAVKAELKVASIRTPAGGL